MTEKEVLNVLQEAGAVITNSHIVYTSGKHGSAYVNKDAVYPYTRKISALCSSFAESFYGDDVDIVVAPAIGGVILSQWTAYHLSNIEPNEVLAVYAEKDKDDNFVIKRGYDKLITGKRVLVVEDILTTGGSVKAVVELVRLLGAEVVGVGALCNRGDVTADDIGGVPKLISLTNVKLDAWEEAECPLCAQNVPINTEVGKGREYLLRKNQE